jgi:predicted ATPase
MNRILRHLELVREKVPDWKAYPFSIPAVAGLSRYMRNPMARLSCGSL